MGISLLPAGPFPIGFVFGRLGKLLHRPVKRAMKSLFFHGFHACRHAAPGLGLVPSLHRDGWLKWPPAVCFGINHNE
jgi:hypothetical protein